MPSMVIHLRRVLLTFGFLAAAASTLSASSVEFVATGTNANSGNPYSADVLFSLVGNTLTITLSNTVDVSMATGQWVPTDVLTGIFFDSTSLNLSPTSATAATVTGDTCTANCNVGSNWEFLNGLNQYGAANGISSTGLNIFSFGNFASPMMALDGIGWGIVPVGFPGAQSVNGGVSGNPFEVGSVVFTLSAPAGFDPTTINAVTFQYGTDLTEGSLAGCLVGSPNCGGGGGTLGGPTPEPMTLELVGAALIGIGFLRRRIA